MLFKRTEVLLLPSDEISIENALRKVYPRVCYVDQAAWQRVDDPPIRLSIQDCGPNAAIWNQEVTREIRGTMRSNGRIDGPQVGPVIQWLRSERRDGRLEAGSWAASVDPKSNPAMEAFAKGAWKILRRLTSDRLVSGGSFSHAAVRGGPVRIFRVGPAALRSALDGELELASNQARLLPEEG
jgi:hypothetical protein